MFGHPAAADCSIALRTLQLRECGPVNSVYRATTGRHSHTWLCARAHIHAAAAGASDAHTPRHSWRSSMHTTHTKTHTRTQRQPSNDQFNKITDHIHTQTLRHTSHTKHTRCPLSACTTDNHSHKSSNLNL